MKTKHTPGPWTASQIYNFDGTLVSYIDAGDLNLMQTRTSDNETTKEEAQANANVAAASPELLEALLDVLENYKDGLHGVDYLINNEKIIKNALSIIQKATS